MVIPPSSTGKPLGVQPVVSQPSWGCTYPGNQPPVSNVNYQPTFSRIVYPGIPYPRKMFMPWWKPNWSYMTSPGGTPMNTIGGYGETPFGGPSFG